MKAVALAPVVAFAILFLLAAGGSSSSGTHSGLRGRVLVQPGSPICKPLPPCARPAAHTLLRFWHSGKLVAHTRTGAKGGFRIALRPRTYNVTSGDGATLVPGRVTVSTARYRRVTFRLDTGIR